VNFTTKEAQWNFPDAAFNAGPSTAQQASSALAQSISGARQSSAVAQVASSAVAQNVSSALAQSISGARESSAVAQVASSALAQSISGARQSSAVAQVASSALAQSISGAQQSSAVAQRDSSAQQQAASSAEQQTASSAQQQTALAAAVAIKDNIKSNMSQIQSDIAANIAAIYTEGASTASGSVSDILQARLLEFEQKKNDLLASAIPIFQLSPTYQDSSLQTLVQDNTLSSFGVKKVFDALRNNYVFLDSNNSIVPSPLTPSVRAYTSGSRQRGGKRKNSRKSTVLFYQP
jgi:hypothetical protein